MFEEQIRNSVAADSQNEIRLTSSELAQNNQEKSLASSLWQAAYENPGKSALAVAATAAGGAALIYAARKGHIAEHLPWKKPNVLLIEDTPGMALAFQDALKAGGHKVTWVTGIKSLNPLTGIAPQGAELSLAGRRFNIALVDGDLGKNMLTGPEIVGTLKSHKIMSIGTSTTNDFNKSMLENGASIAANKGVLYSSLLGKRLDLKAALKQPTVAQEGLDALGNTLRLPENAQLRKLADETLGKFLLGK